MIDEEFVDKVIWYISLNDDVSLEGSVLDVKGAKVFPTYENYYSEGHSKDAEILFKGETITTNNPKRIDDAIEQWRKYLRKNY